MKNYRLAVDENGSPFVLNSKGSIDFGYITEEMNLPAAAIRVAEGDESYGLAIWSRIIHCSYRCPGLKITGK